jgi:hypothetical protein
LRRTVPVRVPGAVAADPDRARVEAARRARTKVRRYCAANRLNRLGTLTYASNGCHDPRQVRADVAVFFKALRSGLGGRPLAYVWVPEWHASGHGLHVHFGVGRFVKRSLIEAAWGRGFVHIKALTDLPVGSTSLTEARRAAVYLSKYVAKTFDPGAGEHLRGLHRYEVGQGYQPPCTRVEGPSADAALARAVQVMGGRTPHLSWSSDQVEDWQGPPALWFQWA